MYTIVYVTRHLSRKNNATTNCKFKFIRTFLALLFKISEMYSRISRSQQRLRTIQQMPTKTENTHLDTVPVFRHYLKLKISYNFMTETKRNSWQFYFYLWFF